MISTKEIAEELMWGYRDVSELFNDVQFLQDVDESLRALVGNNRWGDAQIAKKRKQVLEKIEKLEEAAELASFEN